MTWRARFAVTAFALIALGTAGAGVSFAGNIAAYGAAVGPTAATQAASSRVDPFGTIAVTDGASRYGGPGTGIGGTFSSEDDNGDDGNTVASVTTMPSRGSFTSVFVEDQDFAERFFLAPPKTGPPAA